MESWSRYRIKHCHIAQNIQISLQPELLKNAVVTLTAMILLSYTHL